MEVPDLSVGDHQVDLHGVCSPMLDIPIPHREAAVGEDDEAAVGEDERETIWNLLWRS